MRRTVDPLSWRSAQAWMVLALLAAPAVAQLQFDELRRTHLPSNLLNTRDMVLCDVDGDGDLDLVLASGRHDDVDAQNRLYLNDGAGIFRDATAGRLPRDDDNSDSVVYGDVDGDGDLDLAFGNLGSQNRLYLNDGTGTFTDLTSARMPADIDGTQSLVLGDVDEDGDLDLICGNHGAQNRLYLNDGSGRFDDVTSTRMPPDNDYTVDLALGDVNGDGRPDLMLGNGGRDRLYVNAGPGTFKDATDSLLPLDDVNTYSVALQDLDGDGDRDLVLGRGEQNRLFLNDGSGVFSDGTSGRLPPDPEGIGSSLDVGDVDGDGDLDLVFGGYKEQNRLYLNDGAGHFVDASLGIRPLRRSLLPIGTATRMPRDEDPTTSVVLGDVDGDGDPDLALGSLGAPGRLYFNNGAGFFTDGSRATRLPLVTESGRSAVLGDLDADGDLDLALAGRGRTLLYLNDGSGAFFDGTSARMPSHTDYTNALLMGDVDGDGDPDLVLANEFDPNRVYLNDGSGTFTEAVGALPADTDLTQAGALGDLDGDGDLDLVLGNGERKSQNRLYLNDSSGTFTDATAGRLPAYEDDTRSVALADVDGDGDLDLMFGNYNDLYRLYLNDGSGIFTDGTADRLPLNVFYTQAAVFGDLDGDGDPDLVTANVSSERVYFNDGTGTFTQQAVMGGSQAKSLVLFDVEGDGDLDIVMGDASVKGLQNRLYLNDGSGTLTDATSRMPPDKDRSLGLAVGDVDGDGDVDLVAANDSTSSRLYLNLHRQIDTPWIAFPSRVFAMDFYARPGYGVSDHVALPALNLALAGAPLMLPPFGSFHLETTGLILLPPVPIPAPVGKATLEITVPADPGLLGKTVYLQALIADPSDPQDARLTGYTADLIIR